MLANRYTYGAADPLGNEDPDGHWPKISCGICKKVGDFVGSTRGAGCNAVSNFGSSGLRAAWRTSASACSRPRSSTSPAW